MQFQGYNMYANYRFKESLFLMTKKSYINQQSFFREDSLGDV